MGPRLNMLGVLEVNTWVGILVYELARAIVQPPCYYDKSAGVASKVFVSDLDHLGLLHIDLIELGGAQDLGVGHPLFQ